MALAPGPVIVRRGAVSGATSLQLRAPRPTDPPVVAALPLLQARYALGRLP